MGVVLTFRRGSDVVCPLLKRGGDLITTCVCNGKGVPKKSTKAYNRVEAFEHRKVIFLYSVFYLFIFLIGFLVGYYVHYIGMNGL